MQCEHEGCTREGGPCYLPKDERDSPSYHFCSVHAQEEGFCWCCGGFWGGIESFDFGPGLCENCRVAEDPDEEGSDEDEDRGDGPVDDD